MPEATGNQPLQQAWGIFGGTFDPVHFGHLRLAEEAADHLNLDNVLWIPAGQPTHRRASNKLPGVSGRQRLEMVRLATDGNPRFALDPADVLSERPSYTVPTLERLRADPVCGKLRPLILLLGADAFAGLSTWHRWSELFDLAHIAVAQRPGFLLDPATLEPALAEVFRDRYSDAPAAVHNSAAGRIVSFPMTPLDISATRIRTIFAAGGSPRYLLPDAVIAYIQDTNLYPAKTPRT